MSSFRMTHSFLSSHRNVQKDMSREQVVQPENVQSENVQSENVQFKNVQSKNLRSEDVQPENVLSKNLRKNGGQTLIHPKINRRAEK